MNYIYDKKENKTFMIAAVVLSVLFLLSIIVLLIEDRASNINTPGIIAGLMVYACPLPLLMSWYGYLDSSRYIKRLREGGIDVPYDKKAEPLMIEPPVYAEEEKDSRGSVVLAAICLCITIGIAVYTLIYHIKWTGLGMKDVSFFTGIQVVMIILGLLGAFFFFIQRSKEKYRDDTVFDPGRKARMGVFKGIVTIILCLGITVAALRVLYSITKYVYQTRLQVLYEDGDWREHEGEPLY